MSLLYGFHPVEEMAERTGFFEKDHLFLATRKSNARSQKLVTRARRAQCKISFVSFRELSDKLGHDKHQGVMLQREEEQPITPLDQASIFEPGFRVYLALDGIVDPQNLGAIVRSAVAFAADGIVLPKRRSAPLGAAALKASAGVLYEAPVLFVSGIASFLAEAGRHDCIVVGTSVNAEPLSGSRIKEIKARDVPVILVLGSEEKGMARLVEERCNELARIAHSDKVQSLNVAASAAIMLHSFLGD